MNTIQEIRETQTYRWPSAFFLLPGLTFWLGGAHFLRWGNQAMTVACLIAPFLMLIRHDYFRKTSQIVQFGLAIMWLHTAYHIYLIRVIHSQPWQRMAIILGLISALTLLAAWVLENQRVKAWYA